MKNTNNTAPLLWFLVEYVKPSDALGTPASRGEPQGVEIFLLALTVQTTYLGSSRWEREASAFFCSDQTNAVPPVVGLNFQPFSKIKLSASSNATSSFKHPELHWESNPCAEQDCECSWLWGKQLIILGTSSPHLTCRAWSPGLSRWPVTLKISLCCRGIVSSGHMGFLIKTLETPNLLCFGF